MRISTELQVGSLPGDPTGQLFELLDQVALVSDECVPGDPTSLGLGRDRFEQFFVDLGRITADANTVDENAMVLESRCDRSGTTTGVMVAVGEEHNAFRFPGIFCGVVW